MTRALHAVAFFLAGVAVTLTAAVVLEGLTLVGGHNPGHGGAPD